jgi:lipoprotein-releasing system ATP-binding protein
MILEAQNLSKTYPEGANRLEVLTDASLCVREGETVAVTGQSGCGKSTLLHLLGLLDRPDRGSVLFRDAAPPRDDRTLSRFRNRHLGFVFQFHYLLEDFTALENVMVPALVAGDSNAAARKSAGDLLAALGLESRARHYPEQLSGGEQQRVALARALVNRPDLVLADEPTGNLDPHHADEVVELLLRLNREFGQTFLIVTHNPAIADRMQRHLVLSDGRLETLR